jgi:hypothetical protein
LSTRINAVAMAPVDVGLHIRAQCSGGEQVSVEPGERGVQGDQPAGEQAVQVLALRDAASVRSVIGQEVTLHHDDTIEGIAKRAGGREPGHAGADHNGLSRFDHASDHGAARCSVPRPFSAQGMPSFGRP